MLTVMAFLHSSEILTSIFIGFLTQQLQTFFKRHLSLLLCLVPINQLTESPILHIFRFIHTCSCCLKKKISKATYFKHSAYYLSLNTNIFQWCKFTEFKNLY